MVMIPTGTPTTKSSTSNSGRPIDFSITGYINITPKMSSDVKSVIRKSAERSGKGTRPIGEFSAEGRLSKK